MIGLTTKSIPLFILLQVPEWDGQPLTRKSEYPNLYTDLKQVVTGLKPMTICYILDLILRFM
jgi:hypothetical protein